MTNTLGDFIQDIADFDTITVLSMKDLKRCHILVPGIAKPMGAVFHNNHYFSCVMAYPEEDAAQRGARRLSQKGNRVVLTRSPRGFILWVAELDAQRVWSS